MPWRETDHQKKAQGVLRDLLLLRKTELIPVPYRQETGAAGLSTVYFIFIPDKHPDKQGKNVVVKFDRPDRLASEWKALQEIEREIPGARVILRYPGNNPKHACIVYRSVLDYTPFVAAANFRNFLFDQLVPEPEQCCVPLDLLFNDLEDFYRRGRTLRNPPPKEQWKNYFRTWNDAEIGRVQNDIWRPSSCERKWSLRTPDREASEPTSLLHNVLNEPVDNIRVSRVHGDLNLTNALVCLGNDAHPGAVFLIDVASSKPDWPTALDFAQAETDFWYFVFPDLLDDGKAIIEADRLKALVMCRDWLDGRLRVNDRLPRLDTKIVTAACTFIRRLRNRARTALRGDPAPPDYIMKDYFQALYLTSLNSLRHCRTPFQRQIALLSASLSCRFLENVKEGLYASDKGTLFSGSAPQFASPNKDLMFRLSAFPTRHKSVSEVLRLGLANILSTDMSRITVTSQPPSLARVTLLGEHADVILHKWQNEPQAFRLFMPLLEFVEITDGV